MEEFDKKMVDLNIIVSMTKNRGIGYNNKIPWQIPEDIRHFKQLTEGKTVIMGRRTYESIGHQLYGRNNIVVSSSLVSTAGILVARDIEEAIDLAEMLGRDAFSIGGSRIYEETLPLANRMYISYVKKDYESDTYFPEFIEADFVVENRKNFKEFELVVYRRKVRSQRL